MTQRFDARSETFQGLAASLRNAIRAADRLLRRRNRARRRVAIDTLEGQLASAEAQVEQAHAALDEHTRTTLTRPMRTRTFRKELC